MKKMFLVAAVVSVLLVTGAVVVRHVASLSVQPGTSPQPPLHLNVEGKVENGLWSDNTVGDWLRRADMVGFDGETVVIDPTHPVLSQPVTINVAMFPVEGDPVSSASPMPPLAVALNIISVEVDGSQSKIVSAPDAPACRSLLVVYSGLEPLKASELPKYADGKFGTPEGRIALLADLNDDGSEMSRCAAPSSTANSPR